MKNLAIMAALVMVVALVLAAPADAKTVTGTGRIRAVGRGTIALRARGEAAYTLAGIGKLVVHHRLATKITAHGVGKRDVIGNTVVFTGHKGTVTIEGQKLAARFAGGRVEFRARGRGRVTLHGKGKYWVDGQGPAGWQAGGAQTLALGTPEEDEDEIADAASAEVDEYETETVEVVEDITKFDSFKEWAEAHPNAAAAIKKGKPYAVWAKNHPAAAAALHRQRVAVKKKLDVNEDGAVDAKERWLGVKKRVDANKDGKVQPIEAKRAHQKRVQWKERADLNKDHVVDKKERAVNALRRQRRKNKP